MSAQVGQQPGSLLPLLITILALLVSATFRPALAEDPEAPLDPGGVLSSFGFSVDHLKQIERGEIVSVAAEPAFRKELTGAVAMRLPIRVSELAGRIRSGIIITADPGMIDYGAIDPGRGEADLERVQFSPHERAEALRLFDPQPGDTFNLSATEIALLHERLGIRRSGQETVAEAAAGYRRVLAGRFRAYRERGLDGLAEYDRGDGFSSLPGDELRRVRTAREPIPALEPLIRALDAFPRPPPSTIDQRFYWKKTSVNDRPTFILSRVLVQESPDAVTFALRELYVGHSYNVLQQIGIALPEGNFLVVVALNSTVTDAIPGFFGGMARAIGQRRARQALESYFKGIRRGSAGG